MSSEPKMDPFFKILRVKTNTKGNGLEPKNRYSVDVETALGVFPALIRAKSKKLHLSQPLTLHPTPKAIEKAVSDIVKDLEKQGMIGQDGQLPVEIATPSENAAKRTERTSALLLQLNRETPTS